MDMRIYCEVLRTQIFISMHEDQNAPAVECPYSDAHETIALVILFVHMLSTAMNAVVEILQKSCFIWDQMRGQP